MRLPRNAGALWGRVVAEEFQGWRLDTGHIAKKVSENVCPSCTVQAEQMMPAGTISWKLIQAIVRYSLVIVYIDRCIAM